MMGQVMISEQLFVALCRAATKDGVMDKWERAMLCARFRRTLKRDLWRVQHNHNGDAQQAADLIEAIEAIDDIMMELGYEVDGG